MTGSVFSRGRMRFLLLVPFVACASAVAEAQAAPPDITQHVEVRRTEHGVPHIRADNMEAAGYGLGYVQIQDYGARVAMGLLHARGDMGRWFGRDSIEGDFSARLTYETAVRGYPTLDSDTRAIYDGFAEGVNRYIELHPEEFPEGFAPRFTGYDVLAHEVSRPSAREAA